MYWERSASDHTQPSELVFNVQTAVRGVVLNFIMGPDDKVLFSVLVASRLDHAVRERHSRTQN